MSNFILDPRDLKAGQLIQVTGHLRQMRVGGGLALGDPNSFSSLILVNPDGSPSLSFRRLVIQIMDDPGGRT